MSFHDENKYGLVKKNQSEVSVEVSFIIEFLTSKLQVLDFLII